MEIYSFQTGKVKNDDRAWAGYKCAVVDFKKTEFLDELADIVDYVYQQALYSAQEKIPCWGDDDDVKIRKWIDNLMGATNFLEMKNYYMLLVRSDAYFTSNSGWHVLNEKEMFPVLVHDINKFLNRNGSVDEKEKMCCAWLLDKMGVKCEWEDVEDGKKECC